MPFLRFQVYTFLGSWPWCLALAYLGYRLGTQWNMNTTVRVFFHRFNWAVVGGLVLALVLYVYWRLRGSRR